MIGWSGAAMASVLAGAALVALTAHERPSVVAQTPLTIGIPSRAQLAEWNEGVGLSVPGPRAVRGLTSNRYSTRTFKSQGSLVARNRTTALAQLQRQQATDLEAAARLLERAGQMEPAYKLYSMSLEAAPTLDATQGLARVLHQMDEQTRAASAANRTG